jgi:hypothetical protein
MSRQLSAATLGVALLLGALPAAPAAAQGTAVRAFKTVRGKIEMINPSVNGVAVLSDDGQRMAWQFDKAVIDKIKGFKPGDPVVVILRERGKDKAVTAIAFPGAAAVATYVNMTGERVQFVSGPLVDGDCDAEAPEPPTVQSLGTGREVETKDACWCCAPAGQACRPANKTGLGLGFLTRCYE